MNDNNEKPFMPPEIKEMMQRIKDMKERQGQECLYGFEQTIWIHANAPNNYTVIIFLN